MKSRKLTIATTFQKIPPSDDRITGLLRRFFEKFIFLLLWRDQISSPPSNVRGLRDRWLSLVHSVFSFVRKCNFRMNSTELKHIDQLKRMLLRMASNAEQCVQKAVHSLVSRDQASALSAKAQDSVIDQLEKDVDELAMKLLATGPAEDNLRFISMAMKISTELERVGDEATTLSRRSLELMKEEPLRPEVDIQHIAQMVVEMLKAALDAFVYRRPDEARQIILKDKEVDRLNKSIYKAMTQRMISDSGCVMRCLHYITISKSFERIGDHASNIAEEVVFLCEARDIRHEHIT
ncbi:phosphate signaling complex protein PhoU [Verrucomicrobia bacterium]|nr:phosphate signaling complex protein PhoU [Verrucomicrobiota bacterium]